MQGQSSYQIRPAGQADWQPAMDLAWKTFMRFEASDYTSEGIQNFKDFITGFAGDIFAEIKNSEAKQSHS